jgi:hypothetical protein
VDEDFKYITSLKDKICASFVSLSRCGELEINFDETIYDFIEGIQLGNWLEQPYYSKFSKELGSLLVFLLEPCLKCSYTIENRLDGDFKLTIHFESSQNQNRDIDLIANDSIKDRFWTDQFETLFQTVNGSINLCRWFSFLNPLKSSDYFWNILIMQECKLFLYQFIVRMDYGKNVRADFPAVDAPTYKKKVSLDDFITKWCSEVKV